MKPSNDCIGFIKKWELLVLHAYLDAVGIPTIGYGTTIYKSGQKVKMGDVISEMQADDELQYEVDMKAAKVNEYTKGVTLNQHQFDALVSFAYNCGTGALNVSTLLSKVKANPDDPEIKEEFLKWCKAKKAGKLVVLDGLLKRRAAEASMYFKIDQ